MRQWISFSTSQVIDVSFSVPDRLLGCFHFSVQVRVLWNLHTQFGNSALSVCD